MRYVLMLFAFWGGLSSALAQPVSLSAEVKTSSAEPPLQVELYPLNSLTVLERTDQQELILQNVRSLSGGFFKGANGAMLELANYSVNSGSSYSGIRYEQTEVLGWFRHRARMLGNAAWVFGLGLGGYSEEIVSRIENYENRDHSGVQGLAGLSAGVMLSQSHVRLAFEGRALFGYNLDPNPRPELVARLGFYF